MLADVGEGDFENHAILRDYRTRIVLAYGRPQERAFIRAEARLRRQDPARQRASRLHHSYGRRRGNR